MLPPDAEKHFNIKAYQLVGLLEDGEDVPDTPDLEKGSLPNKFSFDMSDQLDRSRPMTVSSTDGINKITLHQLYQGRKIGFNIENYSLFIKFLKEVYKKKEISNKIAYDFLYDATFEWAINTYKNKRAEYEYCTFIADKIQNSIRNLKFSFEIPYLEIERSFLLGKVLIEYLTPDFFDFHQARMRELNPEEDFNLIREKYQGRVFATYEVRGVERNKAEEIALKECCLAMDVLKLFSPTVMKPEWHVSFDISNRVVTHHENDFFVQDLDDQNQLMLNFFSGVNPYRFTEIHIEHIEKLSKHFVNLIGFKQPNELQQLVLNSLSRFSEAISHKSIHRRIVDLCTIWESLLLKDNLAPVISSVSNYGSKLVRKTIPERKEFISLMKDMYEIRSAMVHHAKAKALNLDKVAKFQLDTINLMETLILLSKRIPSKVDLLSEIDDSMHGAYLVKT